MTRTIRPLTPLVAAVLLISAIGHSATRAQNTRYFDANDDASGSGVTDGTVYLWDMFQPYWNGNSDGTGASPGTTVAWVNGDNAIFSAGNDGAGLRYGVNIDPGIAAGSATIEDGRVVINAGQLDTGSGTVTVNAGATLEINSQLRLNPAGKLLLSGGTLFNTLAGQAGGLINSNKKLEINGSGTIGYDDGDLTPDNKVSIYNGVISGTGGTPANGGAGTLIKIGTDQIGIGGTDLGGGLNSQSQFSFAKLVVKQGGYRGRNVTINSAIQLDERIFGAVPLSVLYDAITLDGGGIGVNFNTTLHANRGITIGPDGGYFDHGATANLTVPGPLSGAGTLTIGDPTSSATNNPSLTLSNANNVNTFSGRIVGIRGVLQLNSSLNVASLNNGATNNASIAVVFGRTLTVGTASGNDSWSTTISGSGGLTKVGASTQALTGSPTYTGDTSVQGGTLSIASAYLANGADVYLSTGSTFNLGFAGTDIIRSLHLDNVLQPAGTWGAPGSGAQFTSNLLSGTGLLGPTIGVPEPAAVGPALLGLLSCLATGRRRQLIPTKPNNPKIADATPVGSGTA